MKQMHFFTNVDFAIGIGFVVCVYFYILIICLYYYPSILLSVYITIYVFCGSFATMITNMVS